MEEEHRLLNAAPEHLRVLIAFALDTDGRRSELLNLDWRYVDLVNGRVTFVETKNGEDRSVRLSDRALRVLFALEPKESGPVFTYNGNAIKDVKTAFDKARKKAGLEGVRFHDLHHTFASRPVQQGLPLYEVMQMTGHKRLVMVQRYAHLAPEFQERAIVALNRYGHDLGSLGLEGTDEDARKGRNPLGFQGVSMVEPWGIEPQTSTMPL